MQGYPTRYHLGSRDMQRTEEELCIVANRGPIPFHQRKMLALLALDRQVKAITHGLIKLTVLAIGYFQIAI